MSAFTDFRDKIEGKITSTFSASPKPGSAPGSSTDAVTGGIFDAIYSFGRGQVDSATQKLTAAFRATSAGQKIEAEATRQKIQELMPYIIMSVIAIIVGSYYVFRRRG